jgi:hypothetical protein
VSNELGMDEKTDYFIRLNSNLWYAEGVETNQIILKIKSAQIAACQAIIH